MKAKSLYRIFFCAFLFMAGTATLKAQTDEKQKLISLEKRRFDAMIRKDTTMLSAMLADSVTYIHSSGVIDNKGSFLKDIASSRISYLFILPEKVTAYIEGGYGYVYGRANIRFKLASMTGNINQYVSFVEVYRLKNYQWQLILCHNARIEDGAPYNIIVPPQVKTRSEPSIY